LKNDAYHFIKTIISLSSKKGAVENRKRFETEFTEEDDEPLHDGKPGYFNFHFPLISSF